MINNVNNLAANLWASGAGVAKRNSMAGSFHSHLHTTGLELTGDALVSSGFRVPGGGWMSANIFKAENFSSENPVMLVSGIDVCGTPFNKEVNIREIDPRTSSFIELLAFDGYSAVNGKPAMTARIAARAVIMQELNGKEFSDFNAFTKLDFAATLRGLKESLHTNKNYETLMWVNSTVEHFFSHFER